MEIERVLTPCDAKRSELVPYSGFARLGDLRRECGRFAGDPSVPPTTKNGDSESSLFPVFGLGDNRKGDTGSKSGSTAGITVSGAGRSSSCPRSFVVGLDMFAAERTAGRYGAIGDKGCIRSPAPVCSWTKLVTEPTEKREECPHHEPTHCVRYWHRLKLVPDHALWRELASIGVSHQQNLSLRG